MVLDWGIGSKLSRVVKNASVSSIVICPAHRSSLQVARPRILSPLSQAVHKFRSLYGKKTLWTHAHFDTLVRNVQEVSGWAYCNFPVGLVHCKVDTKDNMVLKFAPNDTRAKSERVFRKTKIPHGTCRRYHLHSVPVPCKPNCQRKKNCGTGIIFSHISLSFLSCVRH